MKNSIELDLLEQLSAGATALPLIRRHFESESRYVYALRSMISCGHVVMLDGNGNPVPKHLEEQTLRAASAEVKCETTKTGYEQYQKYWRV